MSVKPIACRLDRAVKKNISRVAYLTARRNGCTLHHSFFTFSGAADVLTASLSLHRAFHGLPTLCHFVALCTASKARTRYPAKTLRKNDTADSSREPESQWQTAVNTLAARRSIRRLCTPLVERCGHKHVLRCVHAILMNKGSSGRPSLVPAPPSTAVPLRASCIRIPKSV